MGRAPRLESSKYDPSEVSDMTRQSSDAPCPPVPAARESSLPHDYSSDSDPSEVSDTHVATSEFEVR